MLAIKIIMSVLKILVYIMGLAAMLVIMSVLSFKTVVTLYLINNDMDD
jgi:hypothetical protein